MTEENKWRHGAYFHELDAWTEYWDIYHPETRGRFYFGDGLTEAGLLTRFLPRSSRPPLFTAWSRWALYGTADQDFGEIATEPWVREAISAVDDLVGDIFARYFGDASDPRVQVDYLHAVHHFATDSLPAATERDARIALDDPRKRTAARHTMDGDLMWFAWAIHLQAAHLIHTQTVDAARHALLMAGVATGCAANFIWRGDRRTRSEYRATADLEPLLFQRGTNWAQDFEGAARETRALFRIRQWDDE